MFLGLDLGTTNVKAAVTDAAGRLLGQASVPVTLSHVGPGGVEQDLEELWAATLGAVRQAIQPVPRNQIQAVGVSSQGGAMQLLDGQGCPVGRVLSWLDDRGHADDDALTQQLGRQWFAQRVGHGASGLAIGQLLRLQREHPGSLTPPARVGFVGDLVVGRLCGQAAHDATSAGLTLLYNPQQDDYDCELLGRLGLEARQLPPLWRPREPAGKLLPAVADATGLPAGIPVSAAVHDQYAAALGTGVVQPGAVMFGAGTAWVLLAVTAALQPPVIDDVFVCRHVVAGLSGQLLSLRNGGSAVDWALRLVRWDGSRDGEVDALLASVPPGSDGVVCWPFLVSYGATDLEAGVRGGWVGLQLAHTMAHLLRAVVEGLAYELNRHLDFLRRAGIPVRRLVMCGGAASSRVTPQILADVTQLPLVCCPGEAGSVLGAAILARGLVTADLSLADLAGEMVPAGRMIEPGPDATAYAAGFRAYQDGLARLSPKG